jgi:uncharacterized phiE125 gp8 family phage protein
MIDTLANVKAAMLITVDTDDALLTRLMSGADAFVTQHTGRDFTGGTFTETHPAGRGVLFLRNYPVTDVTSVKVDPARQFGSDTVRAADTYVLHADRGLIESLTGPFLTPRSGLRDDWPAAVQVVYATATAAVPAQVKEAFSQLIGHWYRQAKTFAEQEYQMLIQRTDGTDAKGWSWSLTNGLKLPPGVLQLLQPYRVPAV